MDVVAVIAAGVAGLATGIWSGLKLGERVRDERPWKYWVLNGAAMVASLFALLLASFTRQIWVWSAVLSVFAGLLTGLKYGYGKSVGLWRTHDRFMHIDEELRD